MGRVVAKEANSITIVGDAGDTHTFLYTELSNIEYETQASKTKASNAAAPEHPVSSPNQPTVSSASTGTLALAGGEVIQFPEGTEFSVRSDGFLDSCCVPLNAPSIGVLDADVKGPGGKVVVPSGATVVMVLVDVKRTGARAEMTFELGSADFNGRHYLISAAKGGLEPGARVTFVGAQAGSPQAKLAGTNVHVDDKALMNFKAVAPVVFKPSM